MRMFFDDEWQLPLTSIITTTPQENNHKIDIKIILICIVWYLYIFMMETSHFYTPDCSQTIFQANQYRPTTDHRNLVSPYIAIPILYHLSIKWTKKKNCQHFIESIHESILLSGKQCTWMKVNDFPASPSNQYSLYKLMLLLNVR